MSVVHSSDIEGDWTLDYLAHYDHDDIINPTTTTTIRSSVVVKKKYKDTSWMATKFVEISKRPEYRDKWISDYDFFKLVATAEYGLESYEWKMELNHEQMKLDKFNLGNFIRAVNTKFKRTYSNFKQGRHEGVLHHFSKLLSAASKRTADPTGRDTRHYYYVTDLSNQVEKPKEGTDLLSIAYRVSSSPGAGGAAEGLLKDDTTATASTSQHDEESKTEGGQQPALKRQKKLSEIILQQTAWDSKEYKMLFKPKSSAEKNGENETVQACLKRRIQDLAHVNRAPRNYVDILDNHDQDGTASEHEIFHLRQKCRILAVAYRNALTYMGGGGGGGGNNNRSSKSWSWQQCCMAAVRDSSEVGYDGIKNALTVTRWNMWFREHESFPLTEKNNTDKTTTSIKADNDEIPESKEVQPSKSEDKL